MTFDALWKLQVFGVLAVAIAIALIVWLHSAPVEIGTALVCTNHNGVIECIELT